jgi:protein-S-isoprenylcysteine O-methyltransferase Ste14
MQDDGSLAQAQTQSEYKSNQRRGIIRWLVQVTIWCLIFAAALFLAAGRLNWPMAWVYVGLIVADKIVAALVLIPRSPDLLTARSQLKGPRDLDRALAGVMALYGPLVTLVVAGLDYRFDWSPPIAPAIQIAAVVVAAPSLLLVTWAMASNRHFYGIFRINEEGGHAVASTGPYAWVRHPGYAAAILFQLATPLMLGSLWALIPAVLTVAAIVARTSLEDGNLQAELEGYADYAGQVRARLLPGIW